MDLSKTLNDLHKEHALLTEVIATLERLEASRQGRRGRLPKWGNAASSLSKQKGKDSSNKVK
jgi:hypothetical protein